MTPEQCLNLKPGAVVDVFWPGSNAGDNRKRAKVRRVNRRGTKVGVHVAMTNTKGRYTGGWGKSVRWFDCEDILEADPAQQTFGLEGDQ